MAETNPETGYAIEPPAEPATVAHVVRERTTLAKLADELGVDIEDFWKHNAELLGGWQVHKRTGERTHVGEVPEGTTVHLPPGTVLPGADIEQGEPAPTPSTRSKSSA